MLPGSEVTAHFTIEPYASRERAAGFVAATLEAFAFIDRDKKAAADYYIRVTGTKEARADIPAMLNDPLLRFGLVPRNIMQRADLMFRKGIIKVRPAGWQELFIPNIHNAPGS